MPVARGLVIDVSNPSLPALRLVRYASPRSTDGYTRHGELGLSRVMGLLKATTVDDEALPRYAEDAIATGVEMG